MEKILFKNRVDAKKLFCLITVILVMTMIFTSCGGYKTEAMPESAPMPYSSSMSSDMAKSEIASSDENGIGGMDSVQYSQNKQKENIMTNRKLIMDGNVVIETLKFEDSVNAMDKLIEDVGGFSEVRTLRGRNNEYSSTRNATYVIRVPSESFEAVLNSMGNIGTVLESNSQGTDITDEYTDSQARVKNLKVQEQTLLDIMAKSSKLEDVITLESRISEIRYEIERIENTLKNYDRLVAFSRITVSIREVTPKNETKPVAHTLGERIASSFNESVEDFVEGLEDFIVWFAGAWITLIFLAILIVLGLMMLKRKKKKNLIAQAKLVNDKKENSEQKE